MRKNRCFMDSLLCAISGLFYAIRTERNFRFHIVAAAFVMWGGYIAQFSLTKFVLIIFLICFVITAELFNTAIENAVDVATDEYHENARLAKDIAAGAVFFAAFIAMLIAIVLFVNKGIIALFISYFSIWQNIILLIALGIISLIFLGGGKFLRK